MIKLINIPRVPIPSGEIPNQKSSGIPEPPNCGLKWMIYDAVKTIPEYVKKNKSLEPLTYDYKSL